MKKIIISLLILVLGIALQAGEISVSGKNTMKYGNGSEWAGTGKDIEIKKEFFENQLDLDFIKDELQFGFTLEATSPSEHNENLQEITKKYITYQKDGYTVTGGDFYTVFGRGLVLDLRESRPEFFNNKITGGFFSAENDYFSAKALGGKSYYKYLNDLEARNTTVEEMKVNVYGGNAVFDLGRYIGNEDLSLETGLSYLSMSGDSMEVNGFYKDMFIKKSEIGAFSLKSAYRGFEFYSEYAVKNVQRDPSVTGWAGYFSAGYATKGFALTVEGKDYYRYGTNPNHLKSGFTPFQNPPEVTIKHRSHLLSSVKHIVNANDELGFYAQLQLEPNEAVEATVKAAMSSRRDADAIMIQTEKRYLPYTDFWGEAAYKIADWKILGGAGYFQDSPFSKDANSLLDLDNKTDNKLAFYDQRITGMVEAIYKVNENSDVKVAGEYQQATTGTESLNKDFNEYYGSLEYNMPTLGYLSFGVTKTTEEFGGDAPDLWLNGEAGLIINANHKLEIFYGRERAGIKCSGGACRQVPEFEGVRATLVSTF